MRRALVTGAARGIGAAIAQRLREDGLAVITLDRDPGCDLQVDLASDDLPDLGAVDVCVSNAAITDTIAPAHRMTDEQWERDIGVNLTGAYRTVRACLPGMREREYGRIVVISSGAATGGLPGQVAYSSSKAGSDRHGEDHRSGERAQGDHRQRRAARADRHREGACDARRGARPDLRRDSRPGGMAEPAEVAGLVSYLASENAGYVTGQEIGIDGGFALNTETLGSTR